MIDCIAKLRPFNNDPITIEGQAFFSVTFEFKSTTVKWHVIRARSDPISLANNKIQPKESRPLNILDDDFKEINQSCFGKFLQNFKCIGNLNS